MVILIDDDMVEDGPTGKDVGDVCCCGDTLWCHTVQSLEETFELGYSIGQSLQQGDVIALVGTLGAGKTHLVKGIACGNGLCDSKDVTSPTFVLVNEYDGRLNLYHLDVYRLSGGDELLALGFEEMYESGRAAVVEWADRAKDAMPSQTVWINIDVVDEHSRRFEFRGVHPRSRRLIADLQP